MTYTSEVEKGGLSNLSPAFNLGKNSLVIDPSYGVHPKLNTSHKTIPYDLFEIEIFRIKKIRMYKFLFTKHQLFQ